MCVVGVRQDSVIWPLLWMLVPPDEAEILVGRKLVAAANAVIGEDIVGRLDGSGLTDGITRPWYAGEPQGA